MEEYLSIETDDFDLTVRAISVDNRQKSLTTLLNQRHHTLVAEYCYLEGIDVRQANCGDKTFQIHDNKIMLDPPIFFENCEYSFEFTFKTKLVSAKIVHYFKGINNRFYPKKPPFKANQFKGNVSTGNNLGWFSLPIVYQLEKSVVKRIELTFRVLPTKIILDTDLPEIYEKIDKEFPLLRFNFLSKTENDSQQNEVRGNFPLFWLAHFRCLRINFEKNLKIIEQQPHNKLRDNQHFVKADKIKGKLSPRIAEKCKEHLHNQEYHHHYPVNAKYLSTDTPENRFIKFVVDQSYKQLNKILQAIFIDKKNEEFSDYLKNDLENWLKPLAKLKKFSFLKNIPAELPTHSSLALQQKSGYSQVYQIWQEMKYYLDFFGENKHISMKSIEELYEIWCFITIKNMLFDLGFHLVESNKNRLNQKPTGEWSLKNGVGGAFRFKNNEGIKIKLAHEPSFDKDNVHIKSYTVTQKPDILLEITFKNGNKSIFIFDAKYRIKVPSENDKKTTQDTQDLVPDDAINQMHRYRDALIYQDQKTLLKKSRPVFGAYALYPGYFIQDKHNQHENPYAQPIREVGIGAFPLLPSEKEQGQAWLKAFLEKQLAHHVIYPQNVKSENILSLQEAYHIPYTGMKQRYHHDLTLTIRLGDERDKHYIESFAKGKAHYYHTKATIFKQNIQALLLSEVSYLAIAYPDDTQQYKITFVYPVHSVIKAKRSELQKQFGALLGKENTSSEDYYLFHLGKPIALKQAIQAIPLGRFRDCLKLTSLTELEKTNDFRQLETLYDDLLDVD
ncbi:DUF2357 domain-containing protein [Lonepinella sp. BR2357]|uniref:DUF2357 domain-containing protein n=1 Tax=Lonepinella sp. BR2357 TaxID=3434549 RepID=UPI003F6DCC41